MAKRPTNELAAMAWIRSIPGIDPQKVSTKLPGNNSLIVPGFVTVMTIGGSPDIYVPRREPIIEVKTWACHPDGDRQDPPWARANDLAEIIWERCLDHRSFGGVLFTKNGYDNVCVPSAYPLTEPMKVPDDAPRFACYTMDLQLHWTRRAS